MLIEFVCLRSYGGQVPPQGPPNTSQGPGNGPQDPYGRGQGPPLSGYQQPPRFPGPPPSQNSSPATINQTQGGSVSTPGYPPGQQPQSDYYRQEPPAVSIIYIFFTSLDEVLRSI